MVLSNFGITGSKFIFIFIFKGMVVKNGIDTSENLFYTQLQKKENIFEMQFTLHNLTHEKIKKYVFILLPKDFC